MEQDSSVNAGTWEFKKGFVRPFFRGIYCMVKYLTMMLLLIMILIGYRFETGFYQYGLSFLLELWFISVWFTRMQNRPTPCICWKKSC